MAQAEFLIQLDDEAAMVDFGRQLGNALKTQLTDGITLFLLGDLGAGKTTLSRGILRAFGHSGAVKSPTYTLVEPYEFAAGVQVNHFDLYRLGDPEELEYMGIRDYFGSGQLCLVEWPMRGEGFLPAADIRVTVVVSGMGRQLQLQAQTAEGAKVLAQLSQ